MKVYVLYEKNYGELRAESPSLEILGVYDREDKAQLKLQEHVQEDAEEWVIDTSCLDDKGNLPLQNYVLMFWKYQENWNCYYAIEIIEKEVK